MHCSIGFALGCQLQIHAVITFPLPHGPCVSQSTQIIVNCFYNPQKHNSALNNLKLFSSLLYTHFRHFILVAKIIPFFAYFDGFAESSESFNCS